MNFIPVFVGGARWGGPAMLYAMLCGSALANTRRSECSYIADLLNAYVMAERHFQAHNQFYFKDSQHMRDVHAEVISLELERTWEWFDKPKILVLSAPDMTGRFPLLAAMKPDSRFLVSVRDPRDVVASRLQFVRKSKGTAQNEQAVRAECDLYNRHYEGLLAGDFGDRLRIVEYEKLTPAISPLKLLGLDAALLGQLASDGKEADSIRPYDGPRLESAVGIHRDVLDPAMEKLVMDTCGALAERVKARAVSLADDNDTRVTHAV